MRCLACSVCDEFIDVLVWEPLSVCLVYNDGVILQQQNQTEVLQH